MYKRFSVALMILLGVLVIPAFALSDAEYLKMKKDAAFKKADRELTEAYKELREAMSEEDFKELKKDQLQWISKGRDKRANELIKKKGYSRVKAYTQATKERTQALREIEISAGDDEEEYNDYKPEKPIINKKDSKTEQDSEDGYQLGKFENIDDEDYDLNLKWSDRKNKMVSVEIGFIQDLWRGEGKLNGDTIKARNGEAEAELKFISDNILEIRVNDEFNETHSWSPEGTYQRGQ